MVTFKGHQFHIIEGTVIGERTDSDTHVYGRISGSGYGGGPVSGNIDSYTTKTQQFWLKLDNGKERHINLGTKTVPLRPGHEIVMVNIDNYTIPCFLYIKNTEDLYAINNPTAIPYTYVTPFIAIIFFLIGFPLENFISKRQYIYALFIASIIICLITLFVRKGKKAILIRDKAKNILMSHIRGGEEISL